MGGQNKEKTGDRICAGLLAHVDSGKTTLSEAILFLAGSIRRMGRVDDRDAFLDTYALERARGITIFSKQAELELDGLPVTLLDTPGHVDFSAEMERTLQVLDCAILVVNGADGVQGHTETLWRLLNRYRIPVFLFVNKMDQRGTDREALLAELKKRLSSSIVDFEGLEAWDGAAEGTAENMAERLEELAMCDEPLLEQYLETGTLEPGEIRRAIRERKVFPCYFGSALKVTGIEEFLAGFRRFVSVRAYPEAFGARVFKISRDEQGNRLTHLKITGGSLKVKDSPEGPEGEKVNQIRIYSGAKYETVNEAGAGRICAVTGLTSTRPGQGFGTETETRTPLLAPVLTYRLEFPSEIDAHKMLGYMRILEDEDPQLHIIWNEALAEIQVQVMGEVQTEVLKDGLKERFGVDVEFGSGSIVYKETILRPVEGVGHFEPLRHYAEVHLLMEPLEPGSGLVFAADCSEDMLDRNWQRLILTHLEEKRHRGVLTGSEITDMKITLVAGRSHLKHTEGGDFRQATYRAVRQGLKEAGCRLLEPYYSFVLEVPAENIGRAMSDVERMQGAFGAPEQDGDMAVLTGSVPAVSMRDYQREVAAYTKGRGRLFLSLKGYEPCHNEAEAAAEIGYDFDLDLQDPAGSVFCSHGAGFTVPWDEVKRYMHVASPFAKSRPELCGDSGTAGQEKPGVLAGTAGQERPGALAGTAGQRASGRSFGAGCQEAEDKELEEIFIRRFGPPRRRTAESDSRRVIRAQEAGRQEKKSSAEAEPVEEYLLVDGYNIIFAWDELNELAKTNIDGARYRLMDILCNYQGYKKCTLIVVFDAYKVAGNTGEALKYHNIHVVYTREAETADQYIEKLAHKIGPKYRVTVATSDGLEQLIIRGQGCLLLSARDLREEIEYVEQMIEEEKRRLSAAPGKSGKNYLLSHADTETRKQLESVRLGKADRADRKGGR